MKLWIVRAQSLGEVLDTNWTAILIRHRTANWSWGKPSGTQVGYGHPLCHLTIFTQDRDKGACKLSLKINVHTELFQVNLRRNYCIKKLSKRSIFVVRTRKQPSSKFLQITAAMGGVGEVLSATAIFPPISWVGTWCNHALFNYLTCGPAHLPLPLGLIRWEWNQCSGKSWRCRWSNLSEDVQEVALAMDRAMRQILVRSSWNIMLIRRYTWLHRYSCMTINNYNLITTLQAKVMFDGEKASLEAILQTNTVHVPKPIKV